MSKAKAWAAQATEWERAKPEKPQGVWLRLGPGRSVKVLVGEDGGPVLDAPLVPHEAIDVRDLCDWARGILDTFDDEKPHSVEGDQ